MNEATKDVLKRCATRQCSQRQESGSEYLLDWVVGQYWGLWNVVDTHLHGQPSSQDSDINVKRVEKRRPHCLSLWE